MLAALRLPVRVQGSTDPHASARPASDLGCTRPVRLRRRHRRERGDLVSFRPPSWSKWRSRTGRFTERRWRSAVGRRHLRQRWSSGRCRHHRRYRRESDGEHVHHGHPLRRRRRSMRLYLRRKVGLRRRTRRGHDALAHSNAGRRGRLRAGRAPLPRSAPVRPRVPLHGWKVVVRRARRLHARELRRGHARRRSAVRGARPGVWRRLSGVHVRAR